MHRRVGQLALKTRQRAELRIDSLCQLSRRRGAAFAQGRPPEGVVVVPSAVVPDRSRSRHGQRSQTLQQIFNRLPGQPWVRRHRDIQVVHVCLVVLVVVQMHGLRIETRLERVIGVGQRRQSERPRRWCGRRRGWGLAHGDSLATDSFGKQGSAGYGTHLQQGGSTVD